ncbi:alpha/beta fold hydrolase [Bradyrhizobium shewense]|nr:alpha/beta hydrolase [Bradyrhizobium shewense]
MNIAFTRSEKGRGTILLIHGNSSCKEIFAEQIPYLSRKGFGVVAVDLPGHGASDDAADPRTTYSFPGYAKVLDLLMTSLGTSQYHVVGWSLGGHIGIEMWANFTSVRSLLVTGTPPVRLSALGASEGFLSSPDMDLAGKEAFSAEDCRRYATAMLDGMPEETSVLWRTVARTDGLARRFMMENGLAGLGTDEVDAVATCPKPLAIVQGKTDPFVNRDHLSRLTYNNLWLNDPILIDGGHAPHLRCAAVFNSHLGDFLDIADAH